MTRCPKCDDARQFYEGYEMPHAGCPWPGQPTPAPPDAPLDFEKKCPNPHCENGMIRDTAVGCATCHGGLDIARSLQAANEAMRSIGERCAGPKWEHARDIDLQRQARAYADAAVKAEREDGIWKRAYDNLYGQFQRETLRTSELSALVKRFIDEHHVRGGHPAIRWTKECALCVILADAVALLAKPLNEEARDGHR